MMEGGYAPRTYDVTGDADWESSDDSKRPPDKRHPYPGELDFIEREARRIALSGPRYSSLNVEASKRRISREFYRIITQRRIYIEGL